MAHLPKINTTFLGLNIPPPTESAFLCDRFWNAVFFESDDFLDDISMSCNDDGSPYEERRLNAFDKICGIATTDIWRQRQFDSNCDVATTSRLQKSRFSFRQPRPPFPQQHWGVDRILDIEEVPPLLPRIIRTSPSRYEPTPNILQISKGPIVSRTDRNEIQRPTSPKSSMLGAVTAFADGRAGIRPRNITPEVNLEPDDDIKVVESDVTIGIVEDEPPGILCGPLRLQEKSPHKDTKALWKAARGLHTESNSGLFYHVNSAKSDRPYLRVDDA